MAKHKDARGHGRSHAHDVVHADAHRPNVKLYLGVFAALMVLTGLTVFVSRFHLPRPQAIALGLLIAGAKASLVGAIFMHLWGEKKLIHTFLYVAAFFAAILVLPMIDFVMTTHRMIGRADVAAQHPDEGASPAAPSETSAPAPEPAKGGKE